MVGGGLVGGVFARLARLEGHDVVVFDCNQPNSASHAAACLLKESWVADGQYQAAISILTKIARPRKVVFEKQGEASSFSPSDLMESMPVREHITRVGNGVVHTASGKTFRGDYVLVAAGIHSSKLTGFPVYGMAGMALVYPGEHKPHYQVWAPYKQIISFSRDPGSTYVSDGTAVTTWIPDCTKRLVKHAGMAGLYQKFTPLFGYRPWTENKPELVKVDSRIWLATGTRKNGTVLSAIWAKKILEAST